MIASSANNNNEHTEELKEYCSVKSIRFKL